MKKSIAFCIFTAFFSISSSSFSKDLGVEGKVWKIEERDLRERILQSAGNVDEKGIEQAFKKSVDDFYEGFPKRSFPQIERSETKFVDLTVTVQEDVIAPIKNPDTGKWQWKVIVQKGAKANPFDAPTEPAILFFFDGGDPEQAELLKRVVAKYPIVIPIEVAGNNLLKLSKELNKQILYGNEALTNRLKITHVPSFAYQGLGQYSRYLAVSAFARPFNLKQIEGVLQSVTPRINMPQVSEPINATPVK